jgi:hydrogenase maturation factor
MNLIYGEVVDVFQEEGMRFGKVRVGGAIAHALLELLTDTKRGDRVLLCDGVAISKVENATQHRDPPCASQSPVS